MGQSTVTHQATPISGSRPCAHSGGPARLPRHTSSPTKTHNRQKFKPPSPSSANLGTSRYNPPLFAYSPSAPSVFPAVIVSCPTFRTLQPTAPDHIRFRITEGSTIQPNHETYPSLRARACAHPDSVCSSRPPEKKLFRFSSPSQCRPG